MGGAVSDDEVDGRLRAGARGAPGAEHEPDDGAILAWIRGEDDGVEAHLAECAACRVYALELRRAEAQPTLGEAPRAIGGALMSPARPRPHRALRRWVGVAASGAVAAAAALLLWSPPASAPRFDLEEVSRSTAEIRGAAPAADALPRYAPGGALILRLRGDAPIAQLARPVQVALLVLGPDGRTRAMATSRTDQGATIELRAPVDALAGVGAGPHDYWVVVAPPDLALEGRSIDALSTEAHAIWPRRFSLDTPGGSP